MDCMSRFNAKYYCGAIDPFNSVMYCIYLYKYSKKMSNMGYISLADRIYYLNKMLNAVDLYHGINLPNIWFCEHPVGSVMGRAKYGNRFCFYQNCTVGGNRTVDGKLFYPSIGEDVCMYSYSRIIGKCVVGNNVILGTGTSVVNQDVPANVIVFGASPNLIFKENNRGIV